MANKAINESSIRQSKIKERKVTKIRMTEQPNQQEQQVHSMLLPFKGSKGTTIV